MGAIKIGVGGGQNAPKDFLGTELWNYEKCLTDKIYSYETSIRVQFSSSQF